MEKIIDHLYLAIAFLKECNYRCAYCHPFGESKITHGQNLSKEEAIRIIDVAIDIGFKRFRFTGGECTLVPWFSEVVEYAFKKNPYIHINICTNGSMINKYTELFVKYKNRIDLRISLDSTLLEHRKMGFYKVLTPKLIKSLQVLSARKVPVRFNVVVTQQNKSEVYRIIHLATSYGFDVKLLDLYIQDKYLAMGDINSCSKKELEEQASQYWDKNYVDLNDFIPTFEVPASRKIEPYFKDGGFGIPMYAFKINGIKIIFKDSTRGSFYNSKECIEKCVYFKTMCQEGVYTPHVSSNMVLHINGCNNANLRWNLRNKSYKQQLQAFTEILSLFGNIQYIPISPVVQRIKSLR